ncbi:MAG: hypothetical protein BWY54_01004 [Candidatus Dependentiae bacterium ADurb.Bin331]|nr:MAG: hypothetical protein BWY54_01004 [Candidatus Dependentiae bacterium ADurb.Bin331]
MLIVFVRLLTSKLISSVNDGISGRFGSMVKYLGCGCKIDVGLLSLRCAAGSISIKRCE